MALSLACLFAACKKDGVYNPKEKISKIYESSEHYSAFYWYSGEDLYYDTNIHPKTITEQWTWDGKKLASIEYLDGDEKDDSFICVFQYDGNRVDKVVNKSNPNNFLQFVYDGKKLQRMEVYYNGVKSSYVGFTYDGNKLSSIRYPVGDKKSNAKQMKMLERFVMRSVFSDAKVADRVLAAADKAVARRAKSLDEDCYADISVEWDGKNISKMTIPFSDGDKTEYAFVYDDKNNPMKGLYANIFLQGSELALFQFGNKNNITQISWTYYENGKSETGTENFLYTYDGKWPVTRTESYNYTYDDGSWRRGTDVEYYEYQD